MSAHPQLWLDIVARVEAGETLGSSSPAERAFGVVGGDWFYRKANADGRRWMRERFLAAMARIDPHGAQARLEPVPGPREVVPLPTPHRPNLRLVEQARAAAQDVPDDDEDTRW